VGVVFGKIESDPDLFDCGAGILIVAVPRGYSIWGFADGES